MRRAGAALVALGWLVVALGACRKPPQDGGDSTAAPTATPGAPVASVSPPDHLGPDELIEGTERAFGVALPRGVTVESRYPDTVTASGPVTVHALVRYFQPRLQGGSLRESATVATFEHVRTPGLPSSTELDIHLAVVVGATRVSLTSTTSPPAMALPDEAARWKQVGLTPNGKILDPTHLD